MQDHDGSHIKGLLINFLHSFWPSLLKIPGFLLEFITPIVKVTRTFPAPLWSKTPPIPQELASQDSSGFPAAIQVSDKCAWRRQFCPK